MAKRKAAKISPEEEEGVPNEAVPAAPPADSTPPPGISPPGMRLRSGRKKRRRKSKEGADEGEKPAKRRAKQSNTSESAAKPEETTKDDENEQMPMEQEQPPQATQNDDEHMNDESNSEESQSEDDDESTDESMDEEEDTAHKGQNGHVKPQSVAAAVEPAANEAATTAQATATTAAAAAAVEPTNGSKAAARSRLEPISKLRMPSKHTPGKLETTAIGGRIDSRRLAFGTPTNVLNEVPPTTVPQPASTAPVQQQQQQPLASPQGLPTAEFATILAQGSQDEEEEISMTARWYQSASTSLISVACTFQEAATAMIVPQTVHYAEEQEDGEVMETPSSSVWTRANVWFVILLLVQLLCWPLWSGPIWTTVQDTSDRSLLFYKSVLKPKETLIASNISMKEVEDKPIAVEVQQDDLPLKELEALSRLLESLDGTTELESQLESVESKLRKIRGRMRERRTGLTDWLDGLNDVESALRDLASVDPKSMSRRHYIRAEELLGFFTAMAPPELSTKLVDVSGVPFWSRSPSTSSCSSAPAVSEEDDALLTLSRLEIGKEEVREFALASASELIASEGAHQTVRAWVRDALMRSPASGSPVKTALSNGLTKEEALKVIAERVEVQQADQTGKVDYASIVAGASVIRSGERSTTPSLIDSLPLWNRLMQQAHLRFYGYGPEAALTPTYPTDALGQCWAFESVSDPTTARLLKSKPLDDSCGEYATLTIRLGKPTQVTSVMVEHAPRERTDQVESAIKDFRVIGYEDGEAAGAPWPLGSFRYDIDAPRTLQKFVVRTSFKDEPIPEIRSVTLAIDSNWGLSYSCLYRFRVYEGEEQIAYHSEDAVDEDEDAKEDHVDEYPERDAYPEHDDESDGDGHHEDEDERDGVNHEGEGHEQISSHSGDEDAVDEDDSSEKDHVDDENLEHDANPHHDNESDGDDHREDEDESDGINNADDVDESDGVNHADEDHANEDESDGVNHADEDHDDEDESDSVNHANEDHDNEDESDSVNNANEDHDDEDESDGVNHADEDDEDDGDDDGDDDDGHGDEDESDGVNRADNGSEHAQVEDGDPEHDP